jgi:hypothetical protein
MDDPVLELRIGGLPFPHGGPGAEWRYRHAIRPSGPTALDRRAVADFISYEATHVRGVTVEADAELAGWPTWAAPVTRPEPADFAVQCCSDVYPKGCGARLVCHGTPSAALEQVLADGVLLSPVDQTGLDGQALAAMSTWGEPPDYFEYVMLANGLCTAPEAVAMSRKLGRDLVPGDLRPGHPPSARLYFDWSVLATTDSAEFDGVRPVKVHHQLSLEGNLVAIVVNARDARLVDVAKRSSYRDRVITLEMVDPSPRDWASAAYAVAERG